MMQEPSDLEVESEESTPEPTESSEPIEQEELPIEPETMAPLPPLTPEELESSLEALLFISDKSVSLDKFQGYFGESLTRSELKASLQKLSERYQALHHGIELAEVAGGYQLRTKLARASLAQKLVQVQAQKLSSGAMETLAIVAYKQPLMKEDIDQIRGVDSSYFVRNLLTKKLIQITGRSELPGRPLLYSTTPQFLEVFGLKDLASLPSLRELEQMIPASEVGEPEEDPKVREMRRLVGEMKMDRSSALHYNAKDDEVILKEIRERVAAIATSTPTLQALDHPPEPEPISEDSPEAASEVTPESPAL